MQSHHHFAPYSLYVVEILVLSIKNCRCSRRVKSFFESQTCGKPENLDSIFKNEFNHDNSMNISNGTTLREQIVHVRILTRTNENFAHHDQRLNGDPQLSLTF